MISVARHPRLFLASWLALALITFGGAKIADLYYPITLYLIFAFFSIPVAIIAVYSSRPRWLFFFVAFAMMVYSYPVVFTAPWWILMLQFHPYAP